jgi:hypothetical protein
MRSANPDPVKRRVRKHVNVVPFVRISYKSSLFNEDEVILTSLASE